MEWQVTQQIEHWSQRARQSLPMNVHQDAKGSSNSYATLQGAPAPSAFIHEQQVCIQLVSQDNGLTFSQVELVKQ